MDAEEIAALAAGLGKAMVEGMAANDIAREERTTARKQEQAQERDAQATMKRCYDAMERIRKEEADEDQRMVQPAVEEVEAYCDAVKSEVLKGLKHDVRMPSTINYLERYNALVGMQDRKEVLRLIDLTIDAAEKIVQSAAVVDAPAALGDAAFNYAQRVARLNGILVGKPADDASQAPQGFATSQGGADGAGTAEAAEQAFLAALGDMSPLEAEVLRMQRDSNARAQKVSAKIAEASNAAKSAAAQMRRARAARVEGEAFHVGDIAAFTGKASAEMQHDQAQLLELVELVRTSFKTFSQVVRDNGLFAAFSEEGSYGSCSGYVFDDWWNDDLEDEYIGLKPGEGKYGDIATDVCEDKGGDSLERTIERMRTFNKQRYWGMLDDDFSQHVNAFWYDFKKLMQNTNTLFKVDLQAFNAYLDAVRDQAKSAAASFCSRMDHSQVSEFCNEIKKREKKTSEAD